MHGMEPHDEIAYWRERAKRAEAKLHEATVERDECSARRHLLSQQLADARVARERTDEQLAAANAEIERLRAAAPVMLTALALLADEADEKALREIGIWYTENSGCDHLALWLDAERARKAGAK